VIYYVCRDLGSARKEVQVAKKKRKSPAGSVGKALNDTMDSFPFGSKRKKKGKKGGA